MVVRCVSSTCLKYHRGPKLCRQIRRKVKLCILKQFALYIDIALHLFLNIAKIDDYLQVLFPSTILWHSLFGFRLLSAYQYLMLFCTSAQTECCSMFHSLYTSGTFGVIWEQPTLTLIGDHCVSKRGSVCVLVIK